MKKAILYIRVSTDEQADKGYSLRHQEEFLRKYCEMNLIQVVELIKEDYSAKTFNRPAFQEMLRRIKSRKLNAGLLLFSKWDRFSRNAPEAYAMINTLSKLGIEPQGVEQPLDLSIPENKMMLAFYLSAPEVENDRRALNTKVGMRRALKEGRWISSAPRGYDNVQMNGKKFIQPNSVAPHITWAFEQLSTGKYCVEEVRRLCNQRGFAVDRSRFNEIIKNPVYCGRIVVPAYKNEEEMEVKGTHEPIISEALFDKVQHVLTGRRRKKRYTVVSHNELPLRGFLNCKICGKKLTGSASVGGSGSRHYYYHCSKGCRERVKAQVVNDSFYDILNQLSIRSELNELYTSILKTVYRNSQSEKELSLNAVQAETQKLKARIEKAQQLMLDGEMSMSEYKDIKRSLEPKLEDLLVQQVTKNYAENELKAFLREGLKAVKGLGDLYHKADVAGKQAILRSTLSENMVYTDEGVRTVNLNPLISLCFTIDGQDGKSENEKGGDSCLLSRLVARTGIEPVFHP